MIRQYITQYNISYHHSINKKPINADYSALTKKIETNRKTTEESELLSMGTFLVKVTLKIGQEKYLLSILF